jgi:hypothetical protein
MNDAPVNTGRKQDGTFTKGNSGNRNGRPLGARNRTTLAAAALLDGEAEALTRKAIELAKKGDDIAALRLCLERILPTRRDRLLQFDLPKLESAADAAKAVAAITSAVAAGEITTTEATELAKLVDSFVKTLEVADFEERLRRLEEVQIMRELNDEK